MALHWREDNINIVEIKKLMGHSTLQSTMIYQDVTEENKVAIETLDDTLTKSIKKSGSNQKTRGGCNVWFMDRISDNIIHTF